MAGLRSSAFARWRSARGRSTRECGEIADAELLDYLTRVEADLKAYISAALPAGGIVQLDTLAMYGRCCGLFIGIRHLAIAGLGDEAGILARSLFETSLQLEYLAKSDSRTRESLLIRRELQSLDKLEGLNTRVRKQGGPLMAKADLDAITRQRGNLHRRQERLEIKQTRPFPGEKDMAKQLDREGEYLDFLTEHEMTHGSALAQHTRMRVISANEVQLFIQTVEPAFVRVVALAGARDALRALSAAATILGVAVSGTTELLNEGELLWDATTGG